MLVGDQGGVGADDAGDTVDVIKGKKANQTSQGPPDNVVGQGNEDINMTSVQAATDSATRV